MAGRWLHFVENHHHLVVSVNHGQGAAEVEFTGVLYRSELQALLVGIVEGELGVAWATEFLVFEAAEGGQAVFGQAVVERNSTTEQTLRFCTASAQCANQPENRPN